MKNNSEPASRYQGRRWAGRLRWTPSRTDATPVSPIRAQLTTCEPGHVVHVQMREEEVVHGLDLSGAQHVQTALAAVQQQPGQRLSAVDAHEGRVFPPGCQKFTSAGFGIADRKLNQSKSVTPT